MARRKSYNPERRTWRGKSYRKVGQRVKELRSEQKDEQEVSMGTTKPSKKQVDRILRAAYINLLDLKGQRYSVPPVLGSMFDLDRWTTKEIIKFWTSEMLSLTAEAE